MPFRTPAPVSGALVWALLAAPAHADASPESAPAAAAPSSVRSQVALLAGVKGDALVTGLRQGDTFLLGGVEWRGGLWALDADASLHTVGTPTPLGARPGYTGVARLGYRGEAFTLRGGAVLQWTPGTPEGVAAVAWLPSLHAGWRSGHFGLSAGVFDGLGYAPAHLSAHWDGYSVGFVAPLGARLGAEVPFGNGFGLRVEGFAFALGAYQSAMLTASATFDVAGGQPAEARAP